MRKITNKLTALVFIVFVLFLTMMNTNPLSSKGIQVSPLVYSGMISQAGTNAPVVTELRNDLGKMEWVRLSSGRYRVESDCSFTLGRTGVLLQTEPTVAYDYAFAASNDCRYAHVVTKVKPNDGNWTEADGILPGVYFEIIVYP